MNLEPASKVGLEQQQYIIEQFVKNPILMRSKFANVEAQKEYSAAWDKVIDELNLMSNTRKDRSKWLRVKF